MIPAVSAKLTAFIRAHMPSVCVPLTRSSPIRSFSLSLSLRHVS